MTISELRIIKTESTHTVTEGDELLWFIWRFLHKVRTDVLAIEIVATTAFPKPTIYKGFFLIRGQSEETQGCYHIVCAVRRHDDIITVDEYILTGP
jgi:hypothetical protein